MANRLAGKIALVTGIGAGIGHGVGLVFAREGATVIGCDISAKTAEDAQAQAQARRKGLTLDSLHPCDLTRPVEAQRYVDYAVAKHGRIARFADLAQSYSMVVNDRVVFDFLTPDEITPQPAVLNPSSLEAQVFKTGRPYHEPRLEAG